MERYQILVPLPCISYFCDLFPLIDNINIDSFMQTTPPLILVVKKCRRSSLTRKIKKVNVHLLWWLSNDRGWWQVLHVAQNIEAVVHRCSLKKVFLEILQNSQENTCVRVSILIKLQASGGCFWIQLRHSR